VIDNDDDDYDNDPYLLIPEFKMLMANYMDGRSTKRQEAKPKQEQTRSKSKKKSKKTLQLIKIISESRE
jgi:hypothetical protein